ncbi:MAG: substrate-binding domain-containing protein [Spirochaetes bacterium]|nr:substrate-binding domain-containing protein [Spirochaetota bacterium]
MKNKKKRLTIAYVSAFLFNRIGFDLWAGISDEVKSQDVNLICFVGTKLDNYELFSKENIVYKFINKKLIDGVVLWTSDLTAYLNKKNYDEFLNLFNGIPSISIGCPKRSNDMQSIYLDDEGCIKIVMEHLVKLHNYKNIAFVKGPENHRPSQIRFQTYLEELKKYNLPFNEKLISDYAKDWRSNAGIDAVDLFLKKRSLKPKKDIDAIISVSDYISQQISDYLRTKNIGVPEDIAIVSFNNSLESRLSTPPLTTINLNQFDMGRKAVKKLINMINKKGINEDYLIQGELIIRESCGCFYQEKISQKNGILTIKNKSNIDNFSENIYNEFIQNINYKINYINKKYIDSLYNAFIFDINNENSNKFLKSFQEFISHIIKENINLSVCHSLLSIIRKYLLLVFHENDKIIKIERIVININSTINNAIINYDSRYDIKYTSQILRIPDFSLKLINSFKFSEIIKILSEELVNMGINSCYISSFDQILDPLNTSTLIFACKGKEIIDININKKFQTNNILPEQLFNDQNQHQFIVQALSNRGRLFGFIVFESEASQGATLEIIKSLINGAIERALFTEERETLLKNLENKVEERTMELMEANDQLQIAIDEANTANKAKSVFLANMSHEIRTPLNSIIGFAEIINDIEDRDKRMIYQKQIIEESLKLLELINQLLDISKIEAGKLELDFKTFDIKNLINMINTTFALTAKNKGLNYSCEISNKIPDYLIGDELRIRQIIINLISNAIKFTISGFVKISLEVMDKKDDKIKILFKVADSGIGIKEEDQKLIFQNFVQIKNISITQRGTGLGTAISKQLVELMKGQIGVKSKIGEGSTFWFTIEFDIPEDANIIKTKSEAEENLIDNPYVRNSVILLAEDYPVNQKIVMSHLETLGCNVIIAENGLEVIEKLKTNNVDLILMDIQMPIMDGCDATDKIRNELNLTSIPIIAMTANAYVEDMKRYYNFGMNDVIVKPFTKKSFLEKVIKWLFETKSDKNN